MIGQRFWFEYHCYEGHDSSDAEVWYRSHRQCVVIGEADHDGDKSVSFEDRCEMGMQCVYRVRFDDGLEWDVFEDELLDSPEHFERPDPPPRPSTVTRDF